MESRLTSAPLPMPRGSACAFAAAFLTLAAPLGQAGSAGSAAVNGPGWGQGPLASLDPDSGSSRVDVVRGQALLVGAAGPSSLRRGESKRTLGDAHLEISAGCQVRVSVHGEMNLDVFGPSAVEWRFEDDGVTLHFHQLGWADVDVRSGRHVLELPADWRAEFGRSSFHLRALSGGPTELRHNAGSPITLEWRGDPARVRPPVSVYAGSSVRLDQPRYQRVEGVSASADATKAWTRDDRAGWPWRSRADTAQDAAERSVLRRETQVLDELPGTPDGDIARVRAYEADGSSSVRPLRRQRLEGQTYAQVPVAPGALEPAPRVEIITKPRGLFAGGSIALPRRPDRDGAVTLRQPLPQPSTADAEGGPGRSSDASGSSPERAPLPTVPYDKAHWRGLPRASLNGIGEIAAERGSGVEVRVLGRGRTKVFVSASSPAPRWCFTPEADFLLKPGAVAVFEKSGELRMSFGEMEKKARSDQRPLFSQLAPRDADPR
ncbi:MAG: hypothetical protein AAGG01_24610 [Planctomycetota bacterium]